MSDVIDKGSPLPRVTLGFFIGVIALIVGATTWKNTSDAAHRDLAVQIRDIADRQQKYIERRDEQHASHLSWSEGAHSGQQDEIDALQDELHRICEALAVHLEERICH